MDIFTDAQTNVKKCVLSVRHLFCWKIYKCLDSLIVNRKPIMWYMRNQGFLGQPICVAMFWQRNILVSLQLQLLPRSYWTLPLHSCGMYFMALLAWCTMSWFGWFWSWSRWLQSVSADVVGSCKDRKQWLGQFTLEIIHNLSLKRIDIPNMTLFFTWLTIKLLA